MLYLNNIFEKVYIKHNSKIIKFGIDPTFFSIHLGHLFIINYLFFLIYKNFIIIIIIGDYTTKLKKKINLKNLIINSICLKSQIKNILGEIDVLFNSTWYKKFSLFYFTNLINLVNVKKYINKTFKNNNNNIKINNYIYPIIQSYDSIFLKSEYEIGGIDQLLNIICGRVLQNKFNIKKQNIITLKILCINNIKISKSKIKQSLNILKKNYNFKLLKLVFFNFKNYNKSFLKKKLFLNNTLFRKCRIFFFKKKIYFINRNYISFYYKKILNLNKFNFYKLIYDKKIFINNKNLIKNIFFKKHILNIKNFKILIYDKFYKFIFKKKQ
ncbi:hypothetical protein [Candidatus Carsonella ruddii]|uniref:tyrosine--tRNA ligase n=1 Tax=Candidatus Carsonella ruddii PC isolate NHV TaxID=1202540 RepID=J3TEP6_CARRU|nr:hypothetical protein [Candidatus Carsonella ruddii]AFP84297.1 tyrosyl-tRNA synthetase [Candidatus Carsonella ruddii PC isolate NHV]